MPLRPQWTEDLVLRAANAPADSLIRAGVHPNAITTVGFLVTVSAGWAFYQGQIRLGGFLILLGGLLDIFDGKVARGSGLASIFGSFYDSTLDRISEIVVFLGIMSLFMGEAVLGGGIGMVYAVALAMAGSLMVSYTRARAEALGLDCKVGLMQRAERVFLLGAAALLFGAAWDGMVLRAVIVVLAVMANFTAFQRIVWVYRHTRHLPPAPREDRTEKNEAPVPTTLSSK